MSAALRRRRQFYAADALAGLLLRRTSGPESLTNAEQGENV